MISTGEYMSAPVVSIGVDASVADAATLMDKKDIGSLVVLDGDDLAGIVTERDIIKKVVAPGKAPADVLVTDIMTKDVITIEKDATLMEVASLMKDNQLRRLVVLEDGESVGIITSRDLIGLLV